MPDCTTNSTSYNFFGGCVAGSTGSSTTITGDYHVKIKNGQTLVVNGDLTITGTLTIELVGSTSKVLVSSPYTLNAGNITFDGSATGKVLEVEGTDGEIIVSGTIDFGGNTIEIDGTGSIDAGAITNADNVTCSPSGGGTSTCPIITSGSCDDGASGTLCNDVLPVELLSFNVKIADNVVNLKWVTASELNNDYFTIEKSADGTDFVAIGTIKGSGTTSEVSSYSFQDMKPYYGRSYYRLRQTDFDNTTEVFRPVMVLHTSLVSGEFLAYPNPIKRGGEVTLQIGGAENEQVALTIFDNLGKQVIQRTVSGQITKFKVPDNFEKGVYLIEVISAEVVKTARLVVE